MDIQKAIEARSIGNGTTRLSSDKFPIFNEVSSLHPPLPLLIGKSLGHSYEQVP